MNKTKIEWCDSTWNPVTGCLLGKLEKGNLPDWVIIGADNMRRKLPWRMIKDGEKNA